MADANEEDPHAEAGQAHDVLAIAQPPADRHMTRIQYQDHIDRPAATIIAPRHGHVTLILHNLPMLWDQIQPEYLSPSGAGYPYMCDWLFSTHVQVNHAQSAE